MYESKSNFKECLQLTNLTQKFRYFQEKPFHLLKFILN